MNNIMMNIKRTSSFAAFTLASVVATGLFVSPAVLSAENLTGKALLKSINVRDSEVQELEKGEVVTKLASEYEQSKRELAIDATILIDKPLDELLKESEDETTLVPGKLILSSQVINNIEDFNDVGFTEKYADEAALVLKAGRNDELNLGDADLAIIKALKNDRQGRSDLELAGEAMRQILIKRYQDYMEKGMKGIEPYVRKKGFVSAGAELKLSNEQLFALDDHFPDYFDTLVNFPQSAECCEHRFMWMKAKVRSRPAFILVHRILQVRGEESVLLTERHFYVSHTLNSLQLTLAWLPWVEGDDTTYLGIATSANSDYLTGFVGKMIRVLGGNKGAEMVGGVLEDIRTDLEAGRDPSEAYED